MNIIFLNFLQEITRKINRSSPCLCSQPNWCWPKCKYLNFKTNENSLMDYVSLRVSVGGWQTVR